MSNQSREVILDSSSIINLYATDLMNDIVDLLPYEFSVSQYIIDNEPLHVENSILDEVNEINLLKLVLDGSLNKHEISTEEERQSFVYFAVEMDDGEASCGALAYHRGLIVGSDDKKAIKVFNGVGIDTISTLEIVKNYSEKAELNDEELSNMLRKIQRDANYIPPNSHILYDWWKNHIPT